MLDTINNLINQAECIKTKQPEIWTEEFDKDVKKLREIIKIYEFNPNEAKSEFNLTVISQFNSFGDYVTSKAINAVGLKFSATTKTVSRNKRCPNCKGTDFEYVQGTYACKNCGATVIKKKISQTNTKDNLDDAKHIMKQLNAISGRLLTPPAHITKVMPYVKEWFLDKSHLREWLIYSNRLELFFKKYEEITDEKIDISYFSIPIEPGVNNLCKYGVFKMFTDEFYLLTDRVSKYNAFISNMISLPQDLQLTICKSYVENKLSIIAHYICSNMINPELVQKETDPNLYKTIILLTNNMKQLLLELEYENFDENIINTVLRKYIYEIFETVKDETQNVILYEYIKLLLPLADETYIYENINYEIGKYIIHYQITDVKTETDFKKELCKIFYQNILLPGLTFEYSVLCGTKGNIPKKFNYQQNYIFIIKDVYKIELIPILESDKQTIINIMIDFNNYIKTCKTTESGKKHNACLWQVALMFILELPYYRCYSDIIKILPIKSLSTIIHIKEYWTKYNIDNYEKLEKFRKTLRKTCSDTSESKTITYNGDVDVENVYDFINGTGKCYKNDEEDAYLKEKLNIKHDDDRKEWTKNVGMFEKVNESQDEAQSDESQSIDFDSSDDSDESDE